MRLDRCVLLSVVLAASASTARAEDLRVDAGALPALAKVDERFQSYNVEMAEVIGAHFWKPYAHITSPVPMRAGGEIQAGRDPNIYEQRPPANLYDRRLRALASALGPAYMRVSGTWANSVYFQNDDAATMATPPQGYSGVLTRAEWRGVLDFAKAVDARLVTSFTVSAGVRDASGTWTSIEARPLLEFTRSLGKNIFAAELFNEPNIASYGGGLKGYNAAQFARDEAALRSFVANADPGLRIVGPGDVATGTMAMPETASAEAYLSAEPKPKFDFFSYHYYPAISQRCVAPSDPKAGTTPDQALSEEWLARPDRQLQAHRALRDRFMPGAPIWITETAQAACGGSPWAATFIDTFRYLDQLGRLAKHGTSVIFHNTLAASEYALIDSAKMQPRPNYWAALLWRRLMGQVVLDAGAIQPGFHVYAHCLREHKGGVALLAINTSAVAHTLEVASDADVYALTAPSLESTDARLNGQRLSLGPDDRLPELRPQRAAGKVTVVSKSISFIAIPEARNRSCKYQ